MKNILRISLTLFVITAVVAAALAGVNALTEDRIAAIAAEKTNAAILELFPGSTGVRLLESGEYTDATGTVTAVYQVSGGYAVEVRPSGFGGEIVLMVGIDLANSVAGVSVISHAETPGLGAVAGAKTPAGERFRDSFMGLSGALAVSDIDALTGATVTSQAIVDGVNAALSCRIIQE